MLLLKHHLLTSSKEYKGAPTLCFCPSDSPHVVAAPLFPKPCREPDPPPGTSRGCMQLPAQRAAKASLVCLGTLLPLLQQPGGLPGMALLEGGALEMLPASIHYWPTHQGAAAAAVTWTAAEQVKQARGKQDFGYPRKRKGISAVFKYSLLFSNIRNYRQVRWLISIAKHFRNQEILLINRTLLKPNHKNILSNKSLLSYVWRNVQFHTAASFKQESVFFSSHHKNTILSILTFPVVTSEQRKCRTEVYFTHFMWRPWSKVLHLLHWIFDIQMKLKMARRDTGSLQSSKRQGPTRGIPASDVKHHKDGSSCLCWCELCMAPNLFRMISGQDTAKNPKPELCHLMTLYQYQTKAGIRQQVRILKNNSEGLNIITCTAINNSLNVAKDNKIFKDKHLY